MTPACRALVFTGHMIDAPSRAESRFPAACEALVRQAIAAALERLATQGSVIGLAGAASGGDILFHEGCIARGLATEVRLALPPDAFARASVDPAGPGWRRRYEALLATLPWRVLEPGPTGFDATDDVWARCNEWIMEEAAARVGHDAVTLLALWDSRSSHALGGTGDFIKAATSRGMRTEVLDLELIIADHPT